MKIYPKTSPVKFIASIIYKEEEFLVRAENGLKRLFGDIEPMEKNLPFDYTDYYSGEFGAPLRRKFICFRRLVKLEGIYKAKLMTGRIENLLRHDGKRRVNIDPGYVTEAKLVLLTTKDYTHRICLKHGIFAEVTLYYQDGSFRAWPWSYPDYSSPEAISYFNVIRGIYMQDNRR